MVVIVVEKLKALLFRLWASKVCKTRWLWWNFLEHPNSDYGISKYVKQRWFYNHYLHNEPHCTYWYVVSSNLTNVLSKNSLLLMLVNALYFSVDINLSILIAGWIPVVCQNVNYVSAYISKSTYLRYSVWYIRGFFSDDNANLGHKNDTPEFHLYRQMQKNRVTR